MKDKNNKLSKRGYTEDKTKYGEFISSFFAWIPLSKQKKRAEDLENLGKKNWKNKK